MSPPGTHFTAESTEAMRIKCLAQGHNILMPEFEPSTPVSRNRHSIYLEIKLVLIKIMIVHLLAITIGIALYL